LIGRTDTEAETPILWPPDAKSRLFGLLNQEVTRHLDTKEDRADDVKHKSTETSRKEEGGPEAIFKEMMHENFPYLMKDVNPEIQEVQ